MTDCYAIEDLVVKAEQQTLLDIPELRIEQGICLAVLGQNGAGKTTLLQQLALIQTPDQGRILFNGRTTVPPKSDQRRTIGYVPQHPYLLPGSVADNISLALRLQNIPANEHPNRLQHALETVQLTHLASQQCRHLSGGEQKRVALARVLAYDPQVLLLDEPFSHLDAQHRHQLEDLMRGLVKNQQHTIIFTTHDRLQAHALANHAIHLMNGKLTHTPLLNLFHGYLDGQQFHTPQVSIQVAKAQPGARYIAIDPQQIIVSTLPHADSSARNQLQGHIIQIADEQLQVRLTVACGETFHVIISAESLKQLQFALSDTVWLSFKSTAVTLL